MSFRFSIYHTSDIHGAILSYNYALDKHEMIGLLRIKSYLDKHRNDEDLLIDSGDILQGSALSDYLAKNPLKVHPFSNIMNAMKYNVVTLGNHDFNYGKSFLKSYLSTLKMPLLNANILKGTIPWVGEKSWIKTFSNGFKVGIIGVTTNYIPNWEKPSHIEGLIFKDVYETLKEEVDHLRPHVDCLVVNYHGGFEGSIKTLEPSQYTSENQGLKIIKEIPGIDLLLTGHQHQIITQKVNTTFVSQPGQKGEVLNQIEIHAKYEDGWTFEINGKSLKLDNQTIKKEDLHLIEHHHKNTLKYLDQTVTTLDQDYLINDALDARIHPSPIVTWINQVQCQATHAEISLCSLGNDVLGFKKNLTLRDIHATYLYPNTLVVKALSKDTIKDAIEKSAEFFDLKNNEIIISDRFLLPKKTLYNFDFWWPLEIVINVSKPIGQRVESLLFNGKPLEDKMYTVAMNNYRASGGGEYHMIKESELIQDMNTDIVEILIKAFESHPKLELPKTQNISIKK